MALDRAETSSEGRPALTATGPTLDSIVLANLLLKIVVYTATATEPPADLMLASKLDARPMSEALQNKGARASDASSINPTKKGPNMVNAIPMFSELGVNAANDEMNPTMASAERMSQYRIFPPYRTMANAII